MCFVIWKIGRMWRVMEANLLFFLIRALLEMFSGIRLLMICFLLNVERTTPLASGGKSKSNILFASSGESDNLPDIVPKRVGFLIIIIVYNRIILRICQFFICQSTFLTGLHKIFHAKAQRTQRFSPQRTQRL